MKKVYAIIIVLLAFVFFQNFNHQISEISKFISVRVLERHVIYAETASQQVAIPYPRPVDFQLIPSTWQWPSTLEVSGEVRKLISGTTPGYYLPKLGPQRNRVLQLTTFTNAIESVSALKSNRLLYRLSLDGGLTFGNWSPVVKFGRSFQNPFTQIINGKTGMSLTGTNMIVLSNNTLAIAVQTWPLNKSRNAYVQTHPNMSFTSAAVLLGHWNESYTNISWTLSPNISVPETASSRGLIEPTIVETSVPGKLMMVMRASNACICNLGNVNLCDPSNSATHLCEMIKVGKSLNQARYIDVVGLASSVSIRGIPRKAVRQIFQIRPQWPVDHLS